MGGPTKTHTSLFFLFCSYDKLFSMLVRATMLYLWKSPLLFRTLRYLPPPLPNSAKLMSRHQGVNCNIVFKKYCLDPVLRSWLGVGQLSFLKSYLQLTSLIRFSHPGSLYTYTKCPGVRFQTTRESPYTLNPTEITQIGQSIGSLQNLANHTRLAIHKLPATDPVCSVEVILCVARSGSLLSFRAVSNRVQLSSECHCVVSCHQKNFF